MSTYKLLTSSNNTASAGATSPQPPGIKVNKQQNQAAQAMQVQVVAQGIGAVSATVQIYGSDDGAVWTAIGDPITATGTNGQGTNGQVINSPYDWFGAALTALSGSSATATVNLSV